MFEGEEVNINLLNYIKAYNLTFKTEPFTPIKNYNNITDLPTISLSKTLMDI